MAQIWISLLQKTLLSLRIFFRKVRFVSDLSERNLIRAVGIRYANVTRVAERQFLERHICLGNSAILNHAFTNPVL